MHETCTTIPNQMTTLWNTRLRRLSDFGLWELAGHLSFKYLDNTLHVDVTTMGHFAYVLAQQGVCTDDLQDCNCCLAILLNIKLDISCSTKIKKKNNQNSLFPLFILSTEFFHSYCVDFFFSVAKVQRLLSMQPQDSPIVCLFKRSWFRKPSWLEFLCEM